MIWYDTDVLFSYARRRSMLLQALQCVASITAGTHRDCHYTPSLDRTFVRKMQYRSGRFLWLAGRKGDHWYMFISVVHLSELLVRLLLSSPQHSEILSLSSLACPPVSSFLLHYRRTRWDFCPLYTILCDVHIVLKHTYTECLGQEKKQ